MELRKRTLIAIGATFACLVLVLYLVSRVILLGSFAELEEQYARRDVARVLSALSDELAALDTMLFDWAAWDDTYTFIEDANEEYIESNLVDETFTNPRLNLMLFINSSGQIVFGKGFDLDNEEEISVPQSLQEHLTDYALLRHPDRESSITGIVLLPEGPLLVASRPILTSEEEGPLRGTMIMGRYLDSTEVERLSEITHVSLSVCRSDDEQMPPDFQAARAALSPSFPQEASVFVQPLSAESVAGYALLNDIYGEPSLMLRVDMPREIYQQGQTSMLYLVFLLMVGGMAFTGMSSLMTDKIVISRLVRLNADVNSIGASGDLSTRVLATGRDELSSLADTINGMLAALERSQTERKRAEEALRESERRFRDVARTTGDWIWEVDSEGRYTYVSPVVEQVLGYTPAEMLDRHYYDFFHPNEKLRVLIQEIFHRKEPFVNLVGSNVHKDGHEVILETSALPLTGAQGNQLGYRGACRDVTAEHRLEERLATVHALGRELVLSGDEQQVAHAAVDAARLLLRCQLCGLWLVDEERKMLVRRAYYASEQVADITTLPLDGERGIIVAVARSGEHVYLPDVREDTRHIDAGIGIRAELCVPLKVEKWVIGVLNVESEKLDAFGGDDRRLLSTLADQAAMAIENARLFQRERKQREQLRTLTTRLTEAEEAERQRLARELHDQVGQNLTALGLNLNIVRSQMPKETADLVRPRLDDSLALVEQMTERIYGVMADLRPPVLDDYGLMAALRWYSARFASRVNIAVTVQGEDPVPRLDAPVENVMFRITQEALTNVAKHAQATQVTVAVEVEVGSGTVRLVVADDGIGFDPTRVAGPDERLKWGLLTMAERVEGVGGHFRIESSPQRGARVIVEVAR